MSRLFECEPPRSGWILLRFQLESGPVEIVTTHIFEPLVDLCRAILMMLKGATDATAHLFDEPGAWRLRLERIPDSGSQDQVSETILYSSRMSRDWNDESGTLLVQAHVPLRKLARDIAFGLQQSFANVDSAESSYWCRDHLRVEEIFDLLRAKSAES